MINTPPQDESSREELDEEEIPDACQETLEKISAYSTKPGRTVFVEDGNTEAWIATDMSFEIDEIK